MQDGRQAEAIRKAVATNGAAKVQRIEHGVYLVPSGSREGITRTVTGLRLDGPDLECGCESGSFGKPCWHVAAVMVAKMEHTAGVRVIGPAPVPAAMVQTAATAPRSGSSSNARYTHQPSPCGGAWHAPAALRAGRASDPIVYARFFTPDSNWACLATEFDPTEGRFFGRVDGFESELGYFLLEELETNRGPLGLPIERDVCFTPRPLSTCK